MMGCKCKPVSKISSSTSTKISFDKLPSEAIIFYLKSFIKKLFSDYDVKLTYIYSINLSDKLKIEAFGIEFDRKSNEVMEVSSYDVYFNLINNLVPDSKDVKLHRRITIKNNFIDIFVDVYEIETKVFSRLVHVVFEVWTSDKIVVVSHDFIKY